MLCNYFQDQKILIDLELMNFPSICNYRSDQVFLVACLCSSEWGHRGAAGFTSLIASRTAVSGKVVRPLTTAAMLLRWVVRDQTLQ